MTGPNAGQRLEFTQHATLLAGRSDAVPLCLKADEHFSRYHFRLEINPPECLLIDLGSRNGTFVNGERVTERRLRHGDVISGGQTQIRFSVVPRPGVNPNDLPSGIDTNDAIADVSSAQDAAGPFVHSRGPVFPAVPGYKVVQELGRGGMGLVYRAHRLTDKISVALKIITPAQAASQNNLRLFVREASILSELDHPGIVRFHEMGVVQGQMFFVMEYVRTVSFQQAIAKETVESRTRIACAIICRVLEALVYSHAKSLVHRDIKPSNILLHRTRRKLHVKLADFGLAKNFENAGLSGLTSDGDPRGTVSYMPPEQIINSRFAKPSCDIYSAGVTLYQYLSGKLPFKFTNRATAFSAILEQEPIPLVERCPDLPAALVAIVHRALQKNPSDRFLDADEMCSALMPFSKRR